MLRVKDAIIAGSNISIETSGSNFIAPNNYGYMGKDTSGVARYLMYMNTSNQVNIGYDNRLIKLDCTNPIQREGYKIYHEGYKPTASQIGALPTSGGTMTGSIYISTDVKVEWSRNTDYARIHFKNTGDDDTNSYMNFQVGDNGNEFFRFSSVNSNTEVELLTIKTDHLR